MRVLQQHCASRGLGTAALVLLALVALVSLSAPAMAGDGGQAEAAAFNIPIPWLWYVAPIGSVLALVFAWLFYKQVKASPEGDERMKEIAAYVRTGAFAYLRRQYKVVAAFFVVVSIILFIMGQLGVQHPIVFVAFLTGGFFSGLCGFLGMNTATLASNRTAQGAKDGLNRGLTVAFRAGAVMGLVVVGFGLLDIDHILGRFLPGQFGKPVQVCAHHRRFSRIRMHLLQAAQLPLCLFQRLLGHTGTLDALPILLDFLAPVVQFTQFFVNGPHLFA